MTREEKAASILWSRAIKKKYPNCIFCGHNGGIYTLDAAHIIPKSRGKNIRWDLENGMTLCRRCHQTYDEIANDYQRQLLLKQYFDEGKWDLLNTKSRQVIKPNMVEIIFRLKRG